MGKPSDKQIEAWLAAAGKKQNVGKQVLERIIRAGQFIENTARIKNGESLLSGIDFSKDVVVLNKLPDRVYVQYVSKHRGHWFTDTGLDPDLVGIAAGKRKRKLFRPGGSVAALKSRAASVKDTWTVGRLFDLIDPKNPADQARLKKRFKVQSDDEMKKLVAKISRRLGQMTAGGGTQYFVADPSRMKKI